MEQRDICDRLMEIADLKEGEFFPEHTLDETGHWSKYMTALLREAAREIEALRQFRFSLTQN